MQMGYGTLRALVYPRASRRRRVSSYDRAGGNLDFVQVKKGGRAVLADIKASGCIDHVWMTVNCSDRLYPRKILLRIWWDDEQEPSVEVPLGDFFGVGHGKVAHYMSLPLNMVTGNGPARDNRAAMNGFFPMPFSSRARIEIENQCNTDIASFYYYVDYEEWDDIGDTLRFHAQWRRENPTRSMLEERKGLTVDKFFSIPNKDGKENYVILDAHGRGHYVGCNLSIDHIDPLPTFGWFGEGDDMIFVDGEKWPPSLHGTGTEDYFCAAWGYPSGKYDGPYQGVSLAGPTEGPTAYSGKWTMYRFHIEDPVTFERSVRVTIEHGHANCHSSDYSSTAYWYQTEPHKKFPKMPPVQKRLPRSDQESLKAYLEAITERV